MASSDITRGFVRRNQVPTTQQPAVDTSQFGQNTALPSQKVQSFRNQELSGLLSGQKGVTGPVSLTDVALAGSRPQSAVQLSAQRRQDSVRTSNQRLSLIAAAGARNRMAKQPSSGIQQGRVQQGRAYTPDGHLSNARNSILANASSYIGSPYQLGGTTTRGIDCSGLVMMVYGQLGYKLDHYVPSQVDQIGGVRTSINNLRPGDLVAWADGSHIAIYAGNGEIIESQAGARSGPGTRRTKIYTNAGPIYGIALRLPGE